MRRFWKERKCQSDPEPSLTIRTYQSRTADGIAVGRVVSRRPGALGYGRAAGSNSAFGIRRQIRRSGARSGLRDRRERSPRRLTRSVLGVDVAETALAIVRKKADDRAFVTVNVTGRDHAGDTRAVRRASGYRARQAAPRPPSSRPRSTSRPLDSPSGRRGRCSSNRSVSQLCCSCHVPASCCVIPLTNGTSPR